MNVSDLVTRLADPDEARREAARNELRSLGKSGVSTAEGTTLLEAAARPYPPPKFKLGSTAADLIRVVSKKPDVFYVATVRAVFPHLDSAGRTEALSLLAAIDDSSAALALLDLLESTRATGSPEVRLFQLERAPRFPEIYFPRMLESAKGNAAGGIFSLCLAYAHNGAVAPSTLAPHAAPVVDAYATRRSALLSANGKPGAAWVWDDDYQEVRSTVGLVLDLMGYFPTPEVEKILREASLLKDPSLAGFAAGSLLRLGRQVDPAIVERIAASPEMRSWLFDHLRELGKSGLFPTKWATQEALAESVMVKWLAYPTELGRGPDQIEVAKVVTEDVGPPYGVLDWYLLRFRTDPPHWSSKKGWMAGVAGPFKRVDEPSAAAYGDTFSTLAAWDEKTPEEHVQELKGITARWREKAGRGEQTGE